MKLTQEFETIDNFGCEAPDMKRVFVEPAVISCSHDGFTWMLDSKGIVWITYGPDPSVLESPSLSFCLSCIKKMHPFVDRDYLVTRVSQLQRAR